MKKYKARANGNTSYEVITEHECRHQVFGVEEHVRWQLTPDKDSKDKLNGGFREGI